MYLDGEGACDMRAWVSEYKTQKKDDADVKEALEKIQSQLNAQQGKVKPADTQKSDEEAPTQSKDKEAA